MQKKVRNVCVIVLGDIGRSPRMQYHVKSLMEHDYFVDFIGYVDNSPLPDIVQNKNVRIHKLEPFPNFNLPLLLNRIFKVIWQTLFLLRTLFSINRPDYVLCQNPPAIPTLFFCYFYARLTKSKLIIDWHNYGYSILALDSSANHPLVRLSKHIERYFGQKSYANLCVTEAMKKDLEENWKINATVLYDRPSPAFKAISLEQKHNLFMFLSKIYPEFSSTVSPNEEDSLESTAFTIKTSDGNIVLRDNRPGIIFSSTSWTPDEDFDILLKALDVYEQKTEHSNRYPHLLCVITGKGPQKEKYIQEIRSKNWKKVSVITPWLEPNDYPLMIAAADLGVCLHWSSSGLDLPMKVVDMFGCCLPVCAINFNCLSELVQHGENGFVFDDSQSLLEHLHFWFEDFPHNVTQLNTKELFQNNLKKFQCIRWDDNWNKNALPIFN